jgi:hypothetical protein
MRILIVCQSLGTDHLTCKGAGVMVFCFVQKFKRQTIQCPKRKKDKGSTNFTLKTKDWVTQTLLTRNQVKNSENSKMSMERDVKKNPRKFWKYAKWDIRIKNKYRSSSNLRTSFSSIWCSAHLNFVSLGWRLGISPSGSLVKTLLESHSWAYDSKQVIQWQAIWVYIREILYFTAINSNGGVDWNTRQWRDPGFNIYVFLNNAIMFPNFHKSGTIPDCKDALYILVSGFAKIAAVSLC